MLYSLLGLEHQIISSVSCHISIFKPATMAKEKKPQEMFYVFNYFCIDEGRIIHLGVHDGNIQRLGLECFQVHDAYRSRRQNGEF